MARWAAREFGIACALGATGLGIAYLAAAGAPLHYMAIQAAALGIGLASLIILTRIGSRLPQEACGPVLVLLAAALLATALFGMDIDGAARWVRFGSVYVQTSLVLLPPMLVLFARFPGRLGTLAIALAALALALQPDRAMAGALALGVAALALVRRGRFTMIAAAAGIGALVAALLQPDSLPAVPFVDGILFSAFDVHPLLGAAIVAGALVLAAPALGAGEAGPRGAFGALWLGIVAAAALGNYPTPLVGYGGSAVLGYLLSVALLPGRAQLRPAAAGTAAARQGAPPDQSLRAAIV